MLFRFYPLLVFVFKRLTVETLVMMTRQSQGLDFWVEPHGGHVADEDQEDVDQFRPTKSLGAVEPRRTPRFFHTKNISDMMI